jgi:hypothetical protein
MVLTYIAVLENLIEELDTPLSDCEDEEGSPNDWTWTPDNSPSDCNLMGYRYGFAGQFQRVFVSLQEELNEILDVGDPDDVSEMDRRAQRLLQEPEDFSEDHYMYVLEILPLRLVPYINDNFRENFVEDSEVQAVLEFEPWWTRVSRIDIAFQNLSMEEGESKSLQFTEEEERALTLRKPRTILVSKEEYIPCFLGMLDVILSYVHQHRTDMGDPNVEASWGYSKLASSISCVEVCCLYTRFLLLTTPSLFRCDGLM